MKWMLFSLLLLTASSQAVLASQLLPLQDRADLWQQVQQSMGHGLQPSLRSAHSTATKNNQLQWILVKTTSGKIRFEHYDTVYQGYPVLNARVILAINSQGQLQQMLGALATGLSADLPDAAAAFTQDESAVRRWLQDNVPKNHTINGLKLYPAIFIADGLTKAVYSISYRLINKQRASIQRPHLIVDAKTLQVLKQWDALDRTDPTPSPKPITGQLVAAGGAGGNEALGLNCYTPAPGLMAQCLAYQGIDDPIISEVSFENLNVDNIFSVFSGYPFIVTQDGADCWLKNDYVTTIKTVKNTASDTAFHYACDGTTEHFNQQSIYDNDWNYYSFFPINDAHFYGGVVMQMYHQYLRDIYPYQLDDCDNTGFCLKPIKQRANAKGPTGGDMSNANWDGEYVNYGNGGPYDRYSQTTIDIVAHEITHAVTEWNSDPDWVGQSRALDESFSDIAAIAANDFFERHLKGSYATSVPYSNKRAFSWVYGWDVHLYGLGGRDFQLPSRDGVSIDDARDYQDGMAGHTAGGVMNKLFYELVTRQLWSIEETFKLMLEANVSCWTPQVKFEDAASCLLLLTADNNKLRQLDETLHAVGIISPLSEINALPFTFTQQENRVEYKLALGQDIAPATISTIDVNWGDTSTVEPWHSASATAIESWLQRVHDYTETGFMLFSINVTLLDGTEWKAYRNVHNAVLEPTKDITPEPYAFSPKVDAPLAEPVYSDKITVTGIDAHTDILISGGEYAIDDGEFTARRGMIAKGQQVVVKLLSSATHAESTQAMLTIGGVEAAFVVTTLDKPVEPPKRIDEEDGSGGGGTTSLFELLMLLSLMGLQVNIHHLLRKNHLN
ncbi:MAG: M4 family metallopeptidase [Pseudomonadales bacterium]|nr:M4 family metallopeptidase [Pseudomonadales bacterium]